MASQSKRDSPAFLELADIDNDAESGRVLLDGYDFNLYTLVRVSDLGHYAQTLDKLDAELRRDSQELQDGSWELPVRKSYLPTLKDELRKMVPDYIHHRTGL